jgi:ubiquinone/menaquinone biosynthesis C-methylase UbiE
MTTPTGAVIHSAFRYDLLVAALTLGRERRFRERLLVPAELKAGESVLDIGCGTGSLAIAAAQKVGLTGKVAGVDPSPEMIDRARHKARRKKVDIDFHVAWGQALPFPDHSLDVVLSTVMLHHIPRAGREDVLREVGRVLKPAGRLVAIDFGMDPGGNPRAPSPSRWIDGAEPGRPRGARELRGHEQWPARAVGPAVRRRASEGLEDMTRFWS